MIWKGIAIWLVLQIPMGILLGGWLKRWSSETTESLAAGVVAVNMETDNEN